MHENDSLTVLNVFMAKVTWRVGTNIAQTQPKLPSPSFRIAAIQCPPSFSTRLAMNLSFPLPEALARFKQALRICPAYHFWMLVQTLLAGGEGFASTAGTAAIAGWSWFAGASRA